MAEAVRDREFFVRCAQRKPYLTTDVVTRWHIGKAPTLGQCKAAGMTEAQLYAVGLLVQRQYGAVMFFRDCMIFPFFVSGRVMYFASRRLVDHDPKTGEPLSKSAKALSMRGPDSNGRGGVLLDTGFNVDVAAGDASVILVEGPLDAIACTERGHPAIAMVGKCPREGLLTRLRANHVTAYLALDGTADVTEEERLDKGALVGPGSWICEMPTGKDPDDLAAEDLLALKAGAHECVEAWLNVFRGNPSGWRQEVSQAFRRHIHRWIVTAPAHADDLRAQVCGALGLRGDEWAQLLGSKPQNAAQAARASEDDLSDEARKFIDGQLRDKLALIQAMDGTYRDRETVLLLEALVPHLVGVPAVLRDRVKSLVCDTLKIQRKTFDLGMREARASIERQQGVTISGGDVDWAALAKGYICALRSGQLAAR